MRRAVLERFRAEHGDKRIAMLQPKHVSDLFDKLKPFAQRNMLKTLRGLMAFAVKERLIHADPTAEYKPVRIRDTGGFTAWSDDDIKAFENRHAIGTRARLALALLLFTGQRRGDAVRMGRQHVRDGSLSIRQSKTQTPVDIPVLPELRIILEATVATI